MQDGLGLIKKTTNFTIAMNKNVQQQHGRATYQEVERIQGPDKDNNGMYSFVANHEVAGMNLRATDKIPFILKSDE